MKEKGYSRDDWQRHYDENDLGWDLGQVAPPFINLLEEVSRENPNIKTDVVDATIKSEVENFCSKIENVDFFDLNATHDCIYDLLIEQAFFCAISPNQRDLYVATVARVLRSGGMLAGLFYNTAQEGGPPFNTTKEDIIKHFSELFEIRNLAQAKNSAEQRKDKELLAILVKK